MTNNVRLDVTLVNAIKMELVKKAARRISGDPPVQSAAEIVTKHLMNQLNLTSPMAVAFMNAKWGSMAQAVHSLVQQSAGTAHATSPKETAHTDVIMDTMERGANINVTQIVRRKTVLLAMEHVSKIVHHPSMVYTVIKDALRIAWTIRAIERMVLVHLGVMKDTLEKFVRKVGKIGRYVLKREWYLFTWV